MSASQLPSSVDLAAVIVTWNSAATIAAALRSLIDDLQASELSYQVWVVDSASEDESADIVRRGFPQVNLIESETNIGFGAANNVAIRRLGFGSQGQQALMPAALYLLNPDTITHPGATGRLYDALKSRAEVGIAGARLTFADGSFQHSAFRFPGLRQLWAELLPTPGRLKEGRFNGRYPRSLYGGAEPFEVDFTLGATMMLKREAVLASGMFDEAFFIYCEEVDWAWRLARLGWRALCVPSARVTHIGGASASQAAPSSLIHLSKQTIDFLHDRILDRKFCAITTLQHR